MEAVRLELADQAMAMRAEELLEPLVIGKERRDRMVQVRGDEEKMRRKCGEGEENVEGWYNCSKQKLEG